MGAVIQTQYCDRNTIFGAIPTIMFRGRNSFTPESWKYQNRTKFLIFIVLPMDIIPYSSPAVILVGIACFYIWCTFNDSF